ncbi:MAG TPA: hypothetical protein VMU84_06650 [Thermoanaerobaculia bacterium]|nr:hypothetical protein [Thermoanaerobaculia bacterium]
MRKLLLPLIALLATLARADELLMPGSFHGDEIRYKSGEAWLALHRGMLQPVRITIEREFDPILDDEGEKTGKRVDVIGAPDALFLVRGTRLHPGPVTAASPQSAELTLGQITTFTFANTKSTMQFRCSRAANPEGYIPCALVLTSNGVEQKLATFDAIVDEQTHKLLPAGAAVPEVVWAGDLDRDGRLDFVVNVSPHYNVWSPALFLSSAAREGEIVAKVAMFTVSGC